MLGPVRLPGKVVSSDIAEGNVRLKDLKCMLSHHCRLTNGQFDIVHREIRKYKVQADSLARKQRQVLINFLAVRRSFNAAGLKRVLNVSDEVCFVINEGISMRVILVPNYLAKRRCWRTVSALYTAFLRL
jgi:hypothetical protein